MTSSVDIADLKRKAIELRGPLGVVTGVSIVVLLGGVVVAIRAAMAGTFLIAAAGGMMVVLGGIGAVIGGVTHQRAYMAAALAAGFTPAEAKALQDQADEEQDD